MDVCIVCRDTEEDFYRLIHKKQGSLIGMNTIEQSPSFRRNTEKRLSILRKGGKWQLVRTQYLNIKNRYLRQNDHDHPSFICYIEAVNNVYNARMSWK